MRFIALFTLSVVGCFAAQRNNDDALIGTWRLVSATISGVDVDANDFGGAIRTFDGVVMSIVSPAIRIRAHYAVGSLNLPKSIDVENLDEPEKGMVRHGSYEVSGNILKICMTLDGGPAPKEIRSPRGSQISLNVLERITK